jgi:hypothetical protein
MKTVGTALCRRKILTMAVLLAAGAGAAAFGRHFRARTVEIIRDQSFGVGHRAITFGVCSNVEFGSFLSNEYQVRLGWRWTESRKGALIGNGVVCDIPAGANACRLLLKQLRSSRSDRVYQFFERCGLTKLLPRLCRWVVRSFPYQRPLTDVTVEVSLPKRGHNDSLHWTGSSQSSLVPTGTSLAAAPGQ